MSNRETWKKDFKAYVESLSLSRDDYKGIMEYIDEFPDDHNADSDKMVCVDAISRQETIHAISDWIYDTTDERLPETVIRSLSAVQPERKPGRWKEHIFEGIMGGRPRALMCNQCNSLSLHATNFCPNCGADMRGEENG